MFFIYDFVFTGSRLKICPSNIHTLELKTPGFGIHKYVPSRGIRLWELSPEMSLLKRKGTGSSSDPVQYENTARCISDLDSCEPTPNLMVSWSRPSSTQNWKKYFFKINYLLQGLYVIAAEMNWSTYSLELQCYWEPNLYSEEL